VPPKRKRERERERERERGIGFMVRSREGMLVGSEIKI
jgi:hypothetical protein